jgi:uncharacterized integral membrane protein
MWHRALRMAAFWAGFATCALIALFLYFNNVSVTLHYWRWEFQHVNLGLVALVPLVVGVTAGYLYHMPARMHHLGEHMRHRRRVHELEKELADLRKGMDNLLEMPQGAKTPQTKALPVPALEAPKNGGPEETRSQPEAIAEIDAAMKLPDEPAATERLKPRPHSTLSSKRAGEKRPGAPRASRPRVVADPVQAPEGGPSEQA